MSSDQNTEEKSIEEKLKESSFTLKWSEINTSILKEVIILVSKDLDLKTVAMACASDDKSNFEKWLNLGQVIRTDQSHHLEWTKQDPYFDCSIVKPFIFVQEIELDS